MENLIQAIRNDQFVPTSTSFCHLKELATANHPRAHFFLMLCLEKKQMSIFYKLIKLGVSLNSHVHHPGESTLLHRAACCEIKSNILDKILAHTDIHAVNENNETAMHVAAKLENWKFLDKLLSYLMVNTKEHCNMVDNEGLSLLHILCMREESSCVTRFLEDVPSMDINDTVSLESKFCPGYSATHFAATYYRYETLKVLIENGAYLNTKTFQGFTTLHILCMIDENHWICLKTIKEFLPSKKKALNTKFGKNLGRLGEYRGEYETFLTRRERSHTLLTEQEKKFLEFIQNSLKNRNKSMQLLLKNNCNVNAIDKNGNHALTHLASNSYSKIDRVNFRGDFLYKKITAEVKNSQLFIAKLLLDHCTDSNKMTSSSESLKVINLINNIGYTTLHKLAASVDSVRELLKILLQFHPDVNAVDKYYTTPLHIAAENENSEFLCTVLQFNYNNEWRRMANVNAQDSFGNTPLRSLLYKKNCSDAKQIACFHTLLEHGADIHLENEKGTSIFSILNDYVLRQTSRQLEGNLNATCTEKIIQMVFKNLMKLRRCGSYTTELYNNFIRIVNIQYPYIAHLTRAEDLERRPREDEQIQRLIRGIAGMLDQNPIGQREFEIPLRQNVVDNYRMQAFEGRSSTTPKLEFLCAIEVEKMRKIKINNYTTLNDVLTKNINRVVSYTKNITLRIILENPNFDKDFPQYGMMLKARFIRGLVRQKLLEEAQDALQLLMRRNIPNSCLAEILSYLNENKLRDIIESKN